jgi:hypothetical protein
MKSQRKLLDIWMDQIIRVCYRDGYIDNIDGFGGVSALIVKLNLCRKLCQEHDLKVFAYF